MKDDLQKISNNQDIENYKTIVNAFLTEDMKNTFVKVANQLARECDFPSKESKGSAKN